MHYPTETEIITFSANGKGRKHNDLPPGIDGKTTSPIWTAPSEEVDAKTASLCETIIPVMQVTPFLCDCGNCNTCLHCKGEK